MEARTRRFQVDVYSEWCASLTYFIHNKHLYLKTTHLHNSCYEIDGFYVKSTMKSHFQQVHMFILSEIRDSCYSRILKKY
jgi:hypothetical protein